MQVMLWSDYICPWCYLARDRVVWLGELDVDVVHLPFELHPDLPPDGRDVRPGGRQAAVYAAVGEECARAGLPFRAPTHVPNSRRALEIAELVRRHWPNRFAAVDDGLFGAHFVDGRDIADWDVLDEIVTSAGAPVEGVRRALDAGEGRLAVDRSVAAAREHGIAATPAWLFGDTFVVPGVQPRELLTRVVSRLRARAGEQPAGPGTVTGTRGV